MHDLFTRGVLPNGQLRPPREQACPSCTRKRRLGGLYRGSGRLCECSALAEDRKGSTTIGPFGSDLAQQTTSKKASPSFLSVTSKNPVLSGTATLMFQLEKQNNWLHTGSTPGDVLASKMGLPPCISCLYPDWMPDGVITADMIRLSPDKKTVNGYWLTAAINHDRVKRANCRNHSRRNCAPKLRLRTFAT